MKQLVEAFYGWYRSSLKNPKYRWLVVLGTLTYLVSPLDISPDVFPIVGWVDDGILITLLVTELMQILQEAAAPKPPQTNSQSADTEGEVIDVSSQEIP